ncbi:APC family permease [Rhodococcus sp. NPDC056960]|uniref:APC family permease n=1 Tax=Rhodococcus sp. NPDC056960 TaxID=3345982 RepID=UPI003641B0CE
MSSTNKFLKRSYRKGPKQMSTQDDLGRTTATTRTAVPVATPTGTLDTGARKGTRLEGRMGGVSLALTVLAFSAPLSVVSGYIPFTIVFNGMGAPFAFVLATVILLLFSVGYVTMAKWLPRPGAFYAFISTGLGKAMGLGAAYLAWISYLLVLTGTCAFLGITATALIESFGGPHTAWWIWSALSWLIVSVFGYFNIELSAKVLSIAMVLEVTLVLIFDTFVTAKGGAEGLSTTPFLPTTFLHGDIGVTMLFAMMVFMGFEATAIFREEVRSPERTIPRATYGAVLFVGCLYTLSCYALVVAFGSGAVDTATAAPAAMFNEAIGRFVSPVFVNVGLVLVITSVLAAMLSIHNVIARYAFNLANDGALPQYFSHVHPVHGSPGRASNLAAAAAGLVVLAMATLPFDEGVLYAQMVGLGSLGVLALMAVVSVAVVTWFARNRSTIQESSIKCYVAPALAAVALAITVVLAVAHLELLVGGEPGQYTWLVGILVAIFLLGVAVALFFRHNNPVKYQHLGRSE